MGMTPMTCEFRKISSIYYIFALRKKEDLRGRQGRKTNYTEEQMEDRIKVVAFDADDTLWDNQTYFDEAETRFCSLMAGYGEEGFLRKELFSTEMQNMDTLGYGVMAFTLSMIETALRLSRNTIPAATVSEIYRIGRQMLRNPATPLPGVEETLETLKRTRPYKTIVITKGNTTDQENKLERSGLKRFFSHIEIVPDKTEKAYREIIDALGIGASELLMVGNSFKSDIAPVLAIGGYGVHIPAKSTWQHEIIEEFDHPHLFRLKDFRDLTSIL